MLSRWDEAPEIQRPQSQHEGLVNICWPGALMTSGPDIVSWGLRHMMGAWHWHRGPGDGRGKEGVSPIRSGGSQGGRSDAGEVSCQYRESQPQVAITHSGALSAIYRIVCVWYEEPPPSPILSFEDWVSIMTCITQTLSWHGQVVDRASCHPDMDNGDNYSAWVWLLQLNPILHTICRARTHTTDPCTVSWLWGMAGPGWAPLSPQAIWCHSHPMCPRPPLTNFTVTDWQCPMSSSTARCSHVRPLRVNLTQYLCLASQETFVTITGALTTLSPLLHSSWHVHLSPAVTCVQAHNGGRPVCNRALTVFLTL